MANETNWGWSAVIAIIALVVGIGIGFVAFPDAECDPCEECEICELDEVIDETNDTDEALDTDDLNAMEKTHEEFKKRYSIGLSAYDLFNAEWQDEIEWEDPVTNITYDYEEILELGYDVNVEDTPDTKDSWDFLNELTLTNVDVEDDEWEVEFDVEIEIDGTDYIYEIFAEVDPLEEGYEGDNLELTQL